MSNYSQIILYGPKDSLTHGDPNKAVKGAQLDNEFAAIASAVSTKIDSAFSSPTVTNLAVTSSSPPVNGLYLPAANTVGIAANSVQRMSLAAAGAVLAVAAGNTNLTANPTLSLSNGSIASAQGQVTGVPENSVTTLFTLTNNPGITAVYLVAAGSAITADAQHYAAVYCVATNTATANSSVILSVPSFFTLQLSGLSVRVIMSTGGAGGYTVQWSYLRIM